LRYILKTAGLMGLVLMVGSVGGLETSQFGFWRAVIQMAISGGISFLAIYKLADSKPEANR